MYRYWPIPTYDCRTSKHHPTGTIPRSLQFDGDNGLYEIFDDKSPCWKWWSSRLFNYERETSLIFPSDVNSQFSSTRTSLNKVRSAKAQRDWQLEIIARTAVQRLRTSQALRGIYVSPTTNIRILDGWNMETGRFWSHGRFPAVQVDTWHYLTVRPPGSRWNQKSPFSEFFRRVVHQKGEKLKDSSDIGMIDGNVSWSTIIRTRNCC